MFYRTKFFSPGQLVHIIICLTPGKSISIGQQRFGGKQERQFFLFFNIYIQIGVFIQTKRR